MISAIFKREFAGYFRTPVAYVFLVIFLVLAGILERQADELKAAYVMAEQRALHASSTQQEKHAKPAAQPERKVELF